MKKLTLILFLLAATAAFAGSNQATVGGNNISCSGVAATGACTSFAFPAKDGGAWSIWTWQTVFTGTPTSITVNLEGSIDGTTWFTLDTTTSTAGEARHVVNKPVLMIRCNVSAYVVNGSTATCQLTNGRL